jgi:hypothetical protein
MADGVPAAALAALIKDLRAIIVQGRGLAAIAVNAEVVRTYWQIGERIVCEEQGGDNRSGYGEQLLEQVGRVLFAEHGRGFAARSLRNMRQLYLAYPNWTALRTKLTWTHYRTLMRITDVQRGFYEQVAAAGRWSSRELDKQINSMLYRAHRAIAQTGAAPGGSVRSRRTSESMKSNSPLEPEKRTLLRATWDNNRLETAPYPPLSPLLLCLRAEI